MNHPLLRTCRRRRGKKRRLHVIASHALLGNAMPWLFECLPLHVRRALNGHSLLGKSSLPKLERSGEPGIRCSGVARRLRTSQREKYRNCPFPSAMEHSPKSACSFWRVCRFGAYGPLSRMNSRFDVRLWFCCRRSAVPRGNAQGYEGANVGSIGWYACRAGRGN